jgi:hypothetical protein
MSPDTALLFAHFRRSGKSQPQSHAAFMPDVIWAAIRPGVRRLRLPSLTSARLSTFWRKAFSFLREFQHHDVELLPR